jgi:AraC-like DNA-binding protein
MPVTPQSVENMMTASGMVPGDAEPTRPRPHILCSAEQFAHLDKHVRASPSRPAPLDEAVLPSGARSDAAARRVEWQIGSCLIAVHAVPGQWKPRIPVKPAKRTGADDWVVRVRSLPTVPRRREICFETGPVEVIVGSLRDSVSDAPPGPDQIAVILPAGMDPALDAVFLARGKGKIVGPRATMLGRFLLLLSDFLPAAEEDDLRRLDMVLRNVIQTALPADGSGLAPAPDRAKVRLRTRIDRVIHQNIASARLDAARIAKLAETSRTTLYRLFEGRGGVAAHVQRLRLERVRVALCDPAQSSIPIAALAERCGFHCVASFNRSFRRAYGTTPGEVRAAALAPASPALPPVAHPVAHPVAGDTSSGPRLAGSGN